MINGSSNEIPDLESKYSAEVRQKFDAILNAMTPELPENVAYAQKLYGELTNAEASLYIQYEADLAKIEAHKTTLRRAGYFLSDKSQNKSQTSDLKSSTESKSAPKRKKPGCTIS